MNAAFLSYAHVADAKIAAAVHHGLQQFARPWNRMRAVRVFRDRAGLSANANLWSAIVAAMNDSEFFILLASAAAAQRPWVEREVKHWLETRGSDKLLIGLTDGEIVWDAAARDFDWSRTTALPEALRGAFAEEPQWVDLRRARAAEDLGLRNPAFSDAIAELSATLRRIPKDELIGEDVRQHRAFTFMRRGAIVILSALVIALSVAVVEAVRESRRADAKTREAIANADRANAQAKLARENEGKAKANEERANANADRASSRQLAAEAELLMSRPNELRRAALLAVEALRHAPNGASDHVLRAVLRLLPIRDGSFRLGFAVERALFSADGETLLVASKDQAEVWDLRRRKRVRLQREPREIDALAMSTDKGTVALAEDDTLIRFDARTGMRTAGPAKTDLLDTIRLLTFSPDGQALAAAGGFTTKVWEPASNAIATLEDRPGNRVGQGIAEIAFRGDGKALAVYQDGRVVIWSGKEWACRHDVTALDGAADGSFPMLSRREMARLADRYEPGKPINVHDLRIPASRAEAVASDGASSVEINTLDGTASVSTLPGGVELARFVSDGAVKAAAFDAAGRVLTVDAAGVVRRWVVTPPAAFVGEPLAIDTAGRFLITRDPNTHTTFEAHSLRGGRPGKYVRYLSAWAGGGMRVARDSESYPAGVIVEDLTGGGQPIDIRGLALVEDKVAFSPDGRRLAGRTSSGALALVDLARPPAVTLFRDCAAAAGKPLFSPDGRFVAQGSACVWDTHAPGGGKPVLKGNEEDREIGFTGGSAWVVVQRGEMIVARKLAGGRIVRTRSGDRAFALATSPTEPLVAIGAGDGVRLWNPELGASGMDVRGFNHPAVFSAAFSGDGKLLATGSYDGLVLVHETATGAEVARITLDDLRVERSRDGFNGIGTLVFSADARLLLVGVMAGAGDQTTHVVQVRPADLIAEACRRLDSCRLSATDWARFLPDVPYPDRRPR
jgi:WD40 repeat protein